MWQKNVIPCDLLIFQPSLRIFKISTFNMKLCGFKCNTLPFLACLKMFAGIATKIFVGDQMHSQTLQEHGFGAILEDG